MSDENAPSVVECLPAAHLVHAVSEIAPMICRSSLPVVSRYVPATQFNVDGVGVVVLVILEVLNDANAVALVAVLEDNGVEVVDTLEVRNDINAEVLVGADDVLLLETVDAGVVVVVITGVEVLVPTAVLEDVASAMPEDTGVVVTMTLAVLC